MLRLLPKQKQAHLTSNPTTARRRSRLTFHLVRAEKPNSGRQEDDDDKPVSIPDTLPPLGADTDWRAYRARLIQSQKGQKLALTGEEKWAHSVPEPEKGCLLVANPFMFLTSQQYFRKAVILILDHNESGSFGVILNNPTSWRLREVKGTESLGETFGNNQLFLGGDVGGSSLVMVHRASIAPAKDAKMILKDVYMGGLSAVKQCADEGKCNPSDDVKFFLRYAGWGPGQLAGEVAAGVWHPVACSSSVIFSEQCPKRADHWEEVLTLCGGELAELAQASKPSRDSAIMDLVNLPTPTGASDGASPADNSKRVGAGQDPALADEEAYREAERQRQLEEGEKGPGPGSGSEEDRDPSQGDKI